MRVWAVSDLHTDYPDNLKWCEDLSIKDYQEDALIVAGDVSDDLSILEQTLSLLCKRWSHVFYTFGNHELWENGRRYRRYAAA
ncbi:hypothetical protein WJX74_008908 [Apatococcus lobatus]|uniref:Calcineurin-like phosphoesterase domain-containing protein n=1 Tax=Apatococcus lobatus TaxID=904363 RepID=A0AAW1R2W3_9CHLO